MKSDRNFCHIFFLYFFRQVFIKISNIKFHKNPSSGNRVHKRGQTGGRFHADGQTDRQTDITRTIVPFRNFANAPKKIDILFKECIYVFCIDIRRNNDYFPTQN
jgi:hypothetical protein